MSKIGKVGVLAVDPTSPFTGGAILGDRIRMTGTSCGLGSVRPLDGDPWTSRRAFRCRQPILSMLLDAAGFDTILIETVGVGQDEVDIVRLADVTAVILAPGLGDDVQAMKAGMMEIADVYLLNKADTPGSRSWSRNSKQCSRWHTGVMAGCPR